MRYLRCPTVLQHPPLATSDRHHIPTRILLLLGLRADPGRLSHHLPSGSAEVHKLHPRQALVRGFQDISPVNATSSYLQDYQEQEPQWSYRHDRRWEQARCKGDSDQWHWVSRLSQYPKQSFKCGKHGPDWIGTISLALNTSTNHQHLLYKMYASLSNKRRDVIFNY